MTKREAILQAAIDVIAQLGIADSPTILIAKKADAAEVTLFRLFGNKQELLHQTFKEVTQRFQDRCWPAVEHVEGTVHRLAAVHQVAIKYYRKQPEELAFFQQYISSTDGLKRRPDFRYEQGEDVSNYPLVAILDEGKAKGIFKDLPMTALVSLAATPMIMFLREEQIAKIKHTDRIMGLLTQACLEAVHI